MIRIATVAFLVATALTSGAAVGPRILAAGSIPAGALDAEGETLGGLGSAMEILPTGEIAMLSDRGAGDGTIDYRPRLQFFTLARDGSRLELQLVRTLVLRDSNDRAFTGLFPDRPAVEPPQREDGRMCLDPEGLAVAEDDRIFISEEYMPSVREFDADGKFVRRFPTPAQFIPRGSAGPDFAADDADTLVAGREPNRGFEGMALLPDGKLATVLQSGLVQEGGREAGSTRLVVYGTETPTNAAAFRVTPPRMARAGSGPTSADHSPRSSPDGANVVPREADPFFAPSVRWKHRQSCPWLGPAGKRA